MNKSVGRWILAARPKTLPVSASPVLLGVALSYSHLGVFNWSVALLTLLTALLLQIISNYTNDYFDGIKGIDTTERIGPLRVVQSGLISPQAMKLAILLLNGITFLIGLKLIAVGGLGIAIIGVTSLLFAFLYSGGPFPLSHYALGEIFAFFYFGVVALLGTIYLQLAGSGKEQEMFGILGKTFFLYGVSLGLYAAAIMATNNLRDRTGDKAKGKHTLATLTGERIARVIPFMGVYGGWFLGFILLFVDYFWAAPFWHHFNSGRIFALIAMLLLLFIKVRKVILELLQSPISSRLNETLASIGQSLFLQTMILSIGFLIQTLTK